MQLLGTFISTAAFPVEGALEILCIVKGKKICIAYNKMFGIWFLDVPGMETVLGDANPSYS